MNQVGHASVGCRTEALLIPGEDGGLLPVNNMFVVGSADSAIIGSMIEGYSEPVIVGADCIKMTTVDAIISNPEVVKAFEVAGGHRQLLLNFLAARLGVHMVINTDEPVDLHSLFESYTRSFIIDNNPDQIRLYSMKDTAQNVGPLVSLPLKLSFLSAGSVVLGEGKAGKYTDVATEKTTEKIWKPEDGLPSLVRQLPRYQVPVLHGWSEIFRSYVGQKMNLVSESGYA